MSTPKLELRDVRKSFGPTEVLRGIDLSVEDVVDILRTESDPSTHLDNLVVYADDAGYASHERGLERVRDEATTVDVNVLADGLLPRLAATGSLRSISAPSRP